MANFSDPARRHRLASDAIGLARGVAASVRQSFGVSLSKFGDTTQAAFVRCFDSGYDPDPFDGQSRRAEEGIAVRNLSVRYGERLAFEGLTGEFAPASLTAVVGPNG